MVGDILTIFTSATELSEEYVRSEHVVPLTTGMKMRCLDPRQSQILVRDPITEFYYSINEEIRSKTLNFLNENEHINFELLEKCRLQSVRFIDFLLLKRMHNNVKSYDPLPLSLAQKITEIACRRVIQLLEKIEISFVFPVGYKKSVTQLRDFDFTSFARAFILEVRCTFFFIFFFNLFSIFHQKNFLLSIITFNPIHNTQLRGSLEVTLSAIEVVIRDLLIERSKYSIFEWWRRQIEEKVCYRFYVFENWSPFFVLSVLNIPFTLQFTYISSLLSHLISGTHLVNTEWIL
jgi:hypothetical protein